MPQPFYAEALPCESCGAPVSARTWNADYELWIGSDCSCNTPDQPVASCMMAVYEQAETCGELMDLCRAHRLTCPTCGPVELPARKLAEPVQVYLHEPKQEAA